MACKEIAPLSGITPAWAGKSVSSEIRTFSRQDHPRMGGEKTAAIQMLQHKIGSPPRGRGKGHDAKLLGRCIRITPAWAGKSAAETAPAFPRRDHPRVGGEKQIPLPMLVRRSGSPPHGRGKAGQRFQHIQSARITPAWARKSLKMCETSSAR